MRDLERAQRRMVRWMCGVRLSDRVRTKELYRRLEIDEIYNKGEKREIKVVWTCGTLE